MRLLILLCLPALTFAQSVLEGKILDAETGKPVAFASVGIIGTSKGTAANLDGEFTMTVPTGLAVKITCVGYESLVIETPSENGIYNLRPGNTRLKDLTVFGDELDGKRIVLRAFKAVKKNMDTKSFVQKYFYRHYCKDDSVYGRLIEAAVDDYKKKGYRMQRTRAGQKEEVRVTQIRRSFDRTFVANAHLPIALNEALELDVAGYQMKGLDHALSVAGYVSTLRTYRNQYNFNVTGISSYDGKDVYVVTYASKPGARLGGYTVFAQSGTLYIVTKTFAIVKAEMHRTRKLDSAHTTVSYREYNGKYFPYHIVRDGQTIYSQQNLKHAYHIEMMSAEIVSQNFEKFKGKTPGREELLKIPFDSTFWAGYPMVKATPLEESIVSDLGGGRSLNAQFMVYQHQELEALSRSKDGEENFLRFKEDSRGKRILYVDFWASWCGPCIKEMPHELKLAADYAGNVTFVMLSIDQDEQAWQKAITRYQLRRPGFVHFRIGPDADLLKFYITRGIPQYVLFDRSGEHAAVDAKRPSNPLLRKDLDELVKANDNK